MNSIDEIMRRSREARERIIKAGQQYAAQKQQLAKAEALLAEQEAKAAALREQEAARAERERARVARERRLKGLPPATEGTRRKLYKIMMHYDVYWDEIASHSRLKHLDMPRREVYAYLRGLGWSYPVIAKFCNRDHASIMHGVQRYKEEKGLTDE